MCAGSEVCTLPHCVTSSHFEKSLTAKSIERNCPFTRKVVAKVEHMKGVMDTKWNPRTREVTVIYDAKVTSARHIKHFMA